MLKRNRILSLAAALLVSGQLSWAGVAVVVNPSVDVSASTDQVAALFLGKSKKLGGVALTPVDQEDGSSAREQFYKLAAKKNPSQLNAYWSRIIFTGKGQPPEAVLDDDEVKELVAGDASAIGYIDSSAADASVKVLLTLE